MRLKEFDMTGYRELLHKRAYKGESYPGTMAAAWRKATVNPFGGSLAAGALAGGAAYLLAGPLVKTLGGMVGQTYSPEDVETLKRDRRAKLKLAAIIGGMTALGGLALTADGKRPDFGWGSYGPTRPATPPRPPEPAATPETNAAPERETSANRGPTPEKMAAGPAMGKSGSFLPEPQPVRGIDYGKVVGVGPVAALFQTPGMRPYDSAFGVSVVNAAPTIGTGMTTMGGILDSARDKFKSKLDLAGIVDTGVKTAISNVAARAFTNALDGFVGLSASTKNKLVAGGTWAGLVHALVN